MLWYYYLVIDYKMWKLNTKWKERSLGCDLKRAKKAIFSATMHSY